MKRSAAWAQWLLVVAGLAMTGLWLAFTLAHGPTSYDEERLVLGQDMHTWGFLLGVVPTVLVAGTLIVLRGELLGHSGRLAAVGFWIVVGSHLASAAQDAYFRGLGPPFFVPLAGVGLVLLAVGVRGHGLAGVRLLLGLAGSLQLVASVLSFVPGEASDAFHGYRLFGLLAYGIAGLAWVSVGLGLMDASSTPRQGLVPAAPR